MPRNYYESYEIESDESSFRLHYSWTRRDYTRLLGLISIGVIPLFMLGTSYLKIRDNGAYVSLFPALIFLLGFTALGIYKDILKLLLAPRRNILHYDQEIEFLYLSTKARNSRLFQTDLVRIEYELLEHKGLQNSRGYYYSRKSRFEVIVFIKTRDRERIKLFAIQETAVQGGSESETQAAILTLSKNLCHALAVRLGITDKQIKSSKLKYP
ncbi:MAG: hypothetical protein AAFR87_07840 [Bacteroidota bacterium]